MNEFIYESTKQQLLSLNSVSKLNEQVRKYADKQSNYSHSEVFPTEEYLTLKFNYKLLSLALRQYGLKSKVVLPDFLYNRHRDTQKRIMHLALGATVKIPQACSYTEIVDIFEFDTNVHLSESYDYCYIPKLYEIVRDNPIHFTISWNDSLSQFDRYSTSAERKTQYLLKAIRYKQALSPNTPSTILDNYLADMRKQATTTTLVKQQLSKAITLLMEQTAACRTLELECLAGDK